MKSSSDTILAALWQSEGLGWPSVVLPLHAQVFASCCFSTKPAISEFSMKIAIPNDLKNKSQALGVPSTASESAYKCIQCNSDESYYFS